jgi:sucrose phosphorylase
VGLLAEKNAMGLLSQSNVGRDINRPYVDITGINKALEKSLTKALMKLIQFRNSCSAFNGDFEVTNEQSTLKMSWENNQVSTTLVVDLVDNEALIEVNENSNQSIISLNSLLNEA